MREALVNYGIGIQVKIIDLLNSEIDSQEIYNEITDEELYVDILENEDPVENISEICWNIENEIINDKNTFLFEKNKLEKNYSYIIEKFKDNLSNEILNQHVIIFRKSLVEEDVLRMDDDKKIFLFDLEDIKYKNVIKEKNILNGKIKIFLELCHSY